jgi:hypothetical protein
MSAVLPATAVTPSEAKTWALRMTGVVLHMPPVAPVGRTSRMVTFQASLRPVFWMLRPNVPGCPPRVIVAGPDFVRTSTGSVPVTVTVWAS